MAFPLQPEWLCTELSYWRPCRAVANGGPCIVATSEGFISFVCAVSENLLTSSGKNILPNTDIVKICHTSWIEAFPPLQWCGHVIRIDDTCIPKQSFYGQLLRGSRRRGRQYKRYKDCLRDTLKMSYITPSQLEMLASDRTGWRSMYKSAVQDFEAQCVHELEAKRDLQKLAPSSTSNFECQICRWMCCSRIGILSHSKSHAWWWDPSRWRLSSLSVFNCLFVHLSAASSISLYEKLFIHLWNGCNIVCIYLFAAMSNIILKHLFVV